MDNNFQYIRYKSRRNKIIKDSQYLDLLCKFSLEKNLDLVLKTKKKINLEIGFGSGELIYYRAIRDSQNYYVGSELYNPGIIQLLSKIRTYNISNIFIFQNDTRDLFYQIPDNLFHNIYILFPDPWPKKKHHKRRLINNHFLEFIKNKFTCKVFILTDDEDYAESILYDIVEYNIFTIDRMKISKTSPFHTKFSLKAIEKSNYIFTFVLSYTN